MSFKKYLTEMEESASIVCSFSRFQPPTSGHGLLIKKVIEVARAKHCDHVVYLSKTQDKKKNPLDIETKLKWARLMFPGANIKGADESIATFIDMVSALNTVYKKLYLIAGSDRVPEYQKLLDKYNGVDFQYDVLEVISAGERDPDADGAAGMSATKMREAASINNLMKFKQGLPSHIHPKAQAMMDDVRKGMGL